MHLDELPQLLSVVHGDMVLLGPRPERPEFVEVLAGKVSGYVDRLCVPPGISGLAQVNLPSDTDVEDVRRKLILDVEYVKTVGFLLDTRIGFFTVLRLLGLSNRPVLRLLGLDRSKLVAEASQQRVKLLTPAEIAVAAADDAGSQPVPEATAAKESASKLAKTGREPRRGGAECSSLVSPQQPDTDPLLELL